MTETTKVLIERLRREAHDRPRTMSPEAHRADYEARREAYFRKYPVAAFQHDILRRAQADPAAIPALIDEVRAAAKADGASAEMVVAAEPLIEILRLRQSRRR